jgi:hypothetical protein
MGMGENLKDLLAYVMNKLFNLCMLQVYLATEKREPPALGEGLHNTQPIRAKLCPQPRGSQERPYFLSEFE